MRELKGGVLSRIFMEFGFGLGFGNKSWGTRQDQVDDYNKILIDGFNCELVILLKIRHTMCIFHFAFLGFKLRHAKLVIAFILAP